MCPIRVFCCDCSLKSAAIVAAVLNAIVTGLFFMATLFLWGFAGQLNASPYVDSNNDPLIGQLIGISVGTLIGGIISLGILLCLIRAIIKQDAVLLVPWLIGDMINIVIQFGELIASSATMFSHLGLPSLLPLVGFQIAYVSFEIYLWIVILSYYKELESGKNNLLTYANFVTNTEENPQTYAA